jgi:hypothetical protein
VPDFDRLPLRQAVDRAHPITPPGQGQTNVGYVTWTWRYEDASGAVVEGADTPANPTHPSQADAESWLGENFRELAEAGIAQVTLLDAGSEVYGPMSLADE